MIFASLKQLPAIIGGQWQGNLEITFTGISIDSRTIQPGNLFFALRGDKYDGHDFIKQAQRNGAVAAIVMHDVSTSLPTITVQDTCIALGKLAQHWRKSFQLPLIAVTGSNGKTTTKNMLQAIFVQACGGNLPAVLATKGNLNNHIGVPLMLAQLHQQHRYAIIEMGMNHFNEIRYLTQLAAPTTALITNAGPCHLEGVGGAIAGVAKAKGEIFEGLASSGIAVINADDAFADYWRSLNQQRQIVTFGIDKPADIQGEIKDDNFMLRYAGKEILIHLSLLGRHNVMNALAASAASIVNGISLENIKIALEQLSPAPGRMEKKKGRNGAQIIDDTYNANPLSLRAAMQSIVNHPGKKILVLGDMRELGEQAIQLHAESGELAKKLGIDVLLATGDLTQHTVKSFGHNAQHFSDHASLIKAVEEYLQQESTILVKGSRSMKMEQVVNAIVGE